MRDEIDEAADCTIRMAENAATDQELTEDDRSAWRLVEATARAAKVYGQDRKDAAMLIRRLCRRLPSNDPVAVKALDWVSRRGLQGSILRTGQ